MRSAAQRRRNLNRRLLAIATGVAVLGLLYHLVGGREDSDLEVVAPAGQRGYFLSNATLTEMGEDGRPRLVVRAASIEQQLADQSVRLDDLALDYATREFGPWHVTAREGHMPAGRQTISLSGDVTITGEQPQGRATIRTDRLSYDIDRGVVETADPVAVRLGKHVLNARGLRAELDAGTLKLESDVNGRFVP